MRSDSFCEIHVTCVNFAWQVCLNPSYYMYNMLPVPYAEVLSMNWRFPPKLCVSIEISFHNPWLDRCTPCESVGCCWQKLTNTTDRLCVRQTCWSKQSWIKNKFHFSITNFKCTGPLFPQDDALRELVNTLHPGDVDWRSIAIALGSRTEVQCQQRWTKVLSPDLVKGAWTKEVSCACLWCTPLYLC